LASHAARTVAVSAVSVACVGTLYAWTVFVQPLQALLGLDRATLSLVFSAATVAFPAGMLLTPRLFARFRPAQIVVAGLLVAVAGLLCAAAFQSFAVVVLGYGCAFGLANGIVYSAALQIANNALPHRRGFATAVIVCGYAMGGALAAPFYVALIASVGPWHALLAMAVCIAVVALVAWRILQPLRWPAPPSARAGLGPGKAVIAVLWAGFFFGAFSGLLAISHAAGMAAAAGATVPMIALAAALISVGNGIGRIVSGTLIDHLPARAILAIAGLVSLAAQVFLALAPAPANAVIALSVVGLAYGMTASGYPAAVSHIFGHERVSAVFGRVFTAWGVAGLIAAPLGGYVFDRTGGYAISLWIGAGAAVLAILCTVLIPRQRVVA
jgi:OFA family oxalate/formate antiporter-like MFS transporter